MASLHNRNSPGVEGGEVGLLNITTIGDPPKRVPFFGWSGGGGGGGVGATPENFYRGSTQ